ncbi:MAG: ATP-dependent helicase HrpB [Planctomycetota bacterium]
MVRSQGAPQPLPIDAALPDIVAAFARSRCLVLAAAPGSGKTTRVPGALLDAGLDGAVVVLEPRRLAARAAARRVASERGGRVGDEVGYQVRHERRAGTHTRIRFVTEGVLVRQLLADPSLPGVAAVVLDEFHERHLEGDLALAMLREVRETLREDLGLVVMSATLDAAPLCAFLGDAELVEVDAPSHPVRTEYAVRPDQRSMPDRVARAVRRALAETDGDVLAFLPGRGEIAATAAALQSPPCGALVLPLHGQLDPAEQDLAIARQPERRVVLSTNLAESSLTVAGVAAVVDAGWVRRLRHDPARGLDALRLEPISRASADQRRGRAGREGPGVCYRLWTAAEDRARAAHEPPDVTRVDVTAAVLQVRAFAGVSAARFGWFQHPGPAAIERADRLLARLGAVDAAGLSDVGEAMLGLPLHPRLARVLIEADRRRCRRAAAGLVALLAEPRLQRGDVEPIVDAFELLDLVEEVTRRGFDARAARAHGLEPAAVRGVVETRQRVAGRGPDRVEADVNALGRALLTGFPDRVARRAAAHARDAVMVGGRGLQLPTEGVLDADLVVALQLADVGAKQARSRVSLLASIDPAWLNEMFADLIETTEDAELDGREVVVRVRRRRFVDLVLEEKRGGRPDPDAAQQLLLTVLRADPFGRLAGDEDLQRFRARVAWLREAVPDLGLPVIDEAAVVAAAEPLLAGRDRLAGLRAADVVAQLEYALPATGRRALQQDAPERLLLPSGRRAPIDYAAAAGPTVAARIQELFGSRAGPALAAGRQPLVLELLAPNRRPVQVTRDLASFWDNVYPSVRSELRRRYPKHAWPEDPRAAAPTRAGGRRARNR